MLVSTTDAQTHPESGTVKLFALENVRLLDGPFKTAQEVDLKYMLAHDPDRLLAPFRREAGLPKKAEPDGNWESQGLAGHTAGHYVSALALMYASTGDAEVKRRLDYMVSQLAECQKASGDGYVGGVPNGKALWADIGAGELKVNGFGLNDRWVPWYNLHKTFAGLRDAYLIGHNEQAKQVLIGMSDWCVSLLHKLSDQQVQQMLRAEHGGMAEVLAEVSEITGDAKYLAAARRFCDRQILDPLEAGRDELTGKHANTQIPKVIGFEKIANLSHDAGMHRAAVFFWEDVTSKRSVSIGGNSVNEHFNPVDNFTSMIEDRTGPETCNTYNMLRLSEALFEAGPQASIANYYERALFNHILSTEDPTRGGFVYFTPMRPRQYRVYSQAEQGFWCCVGTGFENHAKYGQFIYARSGSDLYVNLFIASQLNWPERGLSLRQETTFPDAAKTHLAMSLQSPARFTVKMRNPDWLASKMVVHVNGKEQAGEIDSDGYMAIAREWRDGDTIDIDLPMKIEAEQLPDHSSYVSLRYGPIVLAAATGTEEMPGLFAGPGRGDHVAPGKLLPLADAPTFVVNDIARLPEKFTTTDQQLSFTTDGLIQPAQYRNLKLIPFFRLHESRYVIYWPVASAEQYAAQRKKIEADEHARLALDAATIDQVTPGLQQSEVDHGYKGERSGNGTFKDRSWRDARGWFSYELKVPSGKDADLMFTLNGGDVGRHFDVFVNDKNVDEVQLDGRDKDKFIVRRIPLPATSLTTLTVRFAARAGSIAGGVFDVRIVQRDFVQEP
jgi:DUF1680 family protein